MTQAKVLNEGRMTLPPEVRRWLRIKDGDKLEFIRDEQGVRIRNLSLQALEKAQKGLEGYAEKLGLQTDEDVVERCREVRRKLYKERYADID